MPKTKYLSTLKADRQTYSRAPWITTSLGKHCGPSQVGVRKSSGFCVISSYFQLPISIAIQTARPTAHNGNRNGKPISLSFISLFMSFTLESLSLLTPSLLANPLNPMGGSKSLNSEVAFCLLVLSWEMGSPPAPKHFKKVVRVDWVRVRACVAEVFWESWAGGIICEVGRLIFKGNKFVWKKETKEEKSSSFFCP